MSELVTLAIHCVHCAREVRLYVSSRPPVTEHRVVWTCPHCYEPNDGKFPGQLEFIDLAEEKE